MLRINLSLSDFVAFNAQWDRLFTLTDNTELRLSDGDGAFCTVTLRHTDLYITSANAAVAYQDVDDDVKPLTFNRHALRDAILCVGDAAREATAEQKALVVFAVSEAARFEPLRNVLYIVMNRFRVCNWTALRGFLNNWVKIRQAIGLGERLRKLTMNNLRDAARDIQEAGTRAEVQKALAYILDFILRNEVEYSLAGHEQYLDLDQLLAARLDRDIAYFGQPYPAGAVRTAAGFNTYVGQGINVITATGPNVESLTAPLFIPQVYQGGSYIHVSPINLSESASQASDEFTQVFKSQEISASLKTGDGLAFFSGGLSAKYGTGDKLTETAKFYSAVASVETSKHMLSAAFLNGKDMRRIVFPQVLKQIDDPSIAPQTLFEVYGTHLVTGASLGGCIQVNGLYRSSERITNAQFQAAVDLGCAYISAHAQAEATQEQKRIIASTSIHCKSYGGDVTVAASMHSFEEISKSFKEWAQSIRTLDNQVLSKVYSYFPLWTLAADKARRDAIERAFIALAQANYAAVAKYFKIQAPVMLLAPVRTLEGKLLTACMRVMPDYAVVPYVPGKPNSSVIFDKIPYAEDIVCLLNQFSGHYLSVAISPGGEDKGLLYANGTAVGTRQQFILEPVDTHFLIKSCHNGCYITARRFPSCVSLIADGSREEALHFEVMRV